MVAKRHKLRRSTADVTVSDQGLLDHFDTLISDLLLIANRPVAVLLHAWPYAIPLGLAGVFIVWNGSIVLGDRTMHEAGLYPQQLGYMACFCIAMSLPTVLWKVSRQRRSTLLAMTASIVVLGTGFFVALRYTE